VSRRRFTVVLLFLLFLGDLFVNGCLGRAGIARVPAGDKLGLRGRKHLCILGAHLLVGFLCLLLVLENDGVEKVDRSRVLEADGVVLHSKRECANSKNTQKKIKNKK